MVVLFIGCITEVVARHVAHAGFRPEDLYQPVSEDSSTQPAQEITADDKVPGSIKEWIWGRKSYSLKTVLGRYFYLCLI